MGDNRIALCESCDYIVKCGVTSNGAEGLYSRGKVGKTLRYE